MKKKSGFSIATTLLVVVSTLNLLIAAPVGVKLYDSWVNHARARTLNHAALNVNLMFNAEKFFSLERGLAMAAVTASPRTSQTLQAELHANRKKADTALAKALAAIKDKSWTELDAPLISVAQGYEELRRVRAVLDHALTEPRGQRPSGLADQYFNAATALIADNHNLVELYVRPFLDLNAEATRQMRFSDIVWTITEYTGREYAVFGKLIAERRFPSLGVQEDLLLWRGRVEYGWDLLQSGVVSNQLLKSAAPLMEAARARYIEVFGRVEDIFRHLPQGVAQPAYPISVKTWLRRAAQAVDSLYAMNDAVLKINEEYVNELQHEAERDIAVTLLLFLSTLALTVYSWRLVWRRVIMPVNSMVDALYGATMGRYVDLPDLSYRQDEIGKLARVLKAFQGNARQLQEERDKAQTANVAKSEFLANMSHEIRTPMNVVLGLATILVKTRPLTDKQAEYIRTLQLSAEALLAIINDLMDFSKIETQSFELEKIPFNLAALISEITALLAIKVEEKGLRFEIDIADVADKEFIGDPTRIRQVLTNICGNAVKFTESGAITLRAAYDGDPAGGHAGLVIAIADTGIGIPAGKIDMIFEKFTQGDSSINRKYGGTGLGLAIAKTFVEMMGGTIAVVSKVGEGTVFTVRLPLPMRQKAPGGGMPPPDKLDLLPVTVRPQGKRVLVVEDYRPNAIVAGAFLREFGYAYDITETGYDALEKIKSASYDAILMDVQMQGLDGLKTTAAIRDYERVAARGPVRIIGMTAHALPGDREKCLAAGMDDYLPKPFEPEDLRRKLLNGAEPTVFAAPQASSFAPENRLKSVS